MWKNLKIIAPFNLNWQCHSKRRRRTIHDGGSRDCRWDTQCRQICWKQRSCTAYRRRRVLVGRLVRRWSTVHWATGRATASSRHRRYHHLTDGLSWIRSVWVPSQCAVIRAALLRAPPRARTMHPPMEAASLVHNRHISITSFMTVWSGFS